MNDLFHPDNPVMRFLTRLFDLILLNILFVICCIPIITIGASVSAAYQVIFKIIDKKDPYIVKNFFSAFKENFKQATLLWILLLIAGLCINAALFVIYNVLDKKFEFLLILVFLLFFIVVSVAVYAFPLMSRYQNNMTQLLKNALSISVTNIPATVIIAVFPLGLLYMTSVFDMNLATVCCLVSIIGCSVIMYISSYVLLHIFKKFENAKTDR